MNIQQLAAKEYAGSISHPVCEIAGCRDEELHDIILTKDGGVYLICESHRKEYNEIVQTANIKKYQRLRKLGISDAMLTKTLAEAIDMMEK